MNGLLHRIDNSLCALFEKDCIRFGATYEQIAIFYDHLITITARDKDPETKAVFSRSFYGRDSALLCFNLKGNRCSLFALNGGVYELFTCTSSKDQIVNFINRCTHIGHVDEVGKTTVITNIRVRATDTDYYVIISYVENCMLLFRKPTKTLLIKVSDPHPPPPQIPPKHHPRFHRKITKSQAPLPPLPPSSSKTHVH